MGGKSSAQPQLNFGEKRIFPGITKKTMLAAQDSGNGGIDDGRGRFPSKGTNLRARRGKLKLTKESGESTKANSRGSLQIS